MPLTIGETVDQLHNVLRNYIEATYHISHAGLVSQRQALLDELGVIHQRPYLESTPKYQAGDVFADLGLPTSVLEMFGEVTSAPVLIHDPPYEHQAAAVKKTLVEGRDLVVMTGTGSGKTEAFLLPILGKLAREAHDSPECFGTTPAVRALVLYPMNALVNDQLGRLRLLFGDERIVRKFMQWSGRPARFARYTSRTLYPGVRGKDSTRLKAIGDYYVQYLELANGPPSAEQQAAQRLVNEFKKRGKWPAKPDLLGWYGKKGARWRDPKTAEFLRCVTLPGDSELFTRHEVQAAAPDILITNYSMLEYMLMRPLERPVFDRTHEWLRKNPDERLFLVLDEAHLYRGAAGAEVALLIRRLRARLGIPPERLQVICTSASFQDPSDASEFGAQLTGKDVSNFVTIAGNLHFRDTEGSGSQEDADALCGVDLDVFYAAKSDDERLCETATFLNYRTIEPPWELGPSLHEALVEFPPMARLVNLTMLAAQPVETLGAQIFEGVDTHLAARAVTTLLALGTLARKIPTAPGLLPCRVHSFYRGLAGLWVCTDPDCSALEPAARGGPCGKMFSQPRDACECGARVLELYTCRNCGTAYARAYTDNLEEPDFLWAEPGGELRTLARNYEQLERLDLLLEEPIVEDVEPADYDLVTGRLNPSSLGERVRQVFIRKDRSPVVFDSDGTGGSGHPGEFVPCGVCRESAAFGRSSVQDHQTKGDQPFQALMAKQLQVQPPSATAATSLAPLRGRKVLVFSDSRQTAARLAPNLQTYSTQDALRPLVVAGFALLQKTAQLEHHVSLEDLYLAALISAKKLEVRLRPQLKVGESFHAEQIVGQRIEAGALENDTKLFGLFLDFRNEMPPEALLRGITMCLTDRYYGLESLALASVVERSTHAPTIQALPDLAGVATTLEQKIALARDWLRCWQRTGFWLRSMPHGWWLTTVKSHSGSFLAMNRRIPVPASRRVFKQQWLPTLLQCFTEQLARSKHRLKGGELSLQIGGDWAYCQACRTTQRPFPGSNRCINCGKESATAIDPESDPVFVARKGYYRASTVEALASPPKAPMALIAAEHTGQLTAAQSDEVFSKAEEHELLFQDVDLGPDGQGRDRPAIDVLSSTTTMEVGIDIGTLSGVSLRNMPPARANYQQRAGRAGRRGNAVATVTAFGSADSHDEHYFTHPEEMIRGIVDDPTLALDNADITRRHLTAYLLQRYHQARLPNIEPEDQPHLFAVLGSVSDFKRLDTILNRDDLASWLNSNATALQSEVSGWLPDELAQDARISLLSNLVDHTIAAIDMAIDYVAPAANGGQGDQGDLDETEKSASDGDEETGLEVPDEVGEEHPARGPASVNLLDRLLYKGVLPRYAFPTDVATFHVFNPEESTRNRPAFHFTPSQGLPVALSQYAPGKEVWIGGKLWTSGAVYSPMKAERFNAWNDRRLYYECRICRYASTVALEHGTRGELRNCDACGSEGTFGPARHWFRPPGFAHPVDREEGTSPDDQPGRSYATRAKLTAPTPADEGQWRNINERLRVHHMRQHLLVTNRGPRNEGYTYCTRCGRIEPSAAPTGTVGAAHRKPFPDDRAPTCAGGHAAKGLVLGTDFITDVLLVSIRVQLPLTLAPGLLATDIALRTVSEALTKAACDQLELEPQELQSEYRPALTEAGWEGREAEIYIYDTLPGGAGFVRRIGDLGASVFERALELLEVCPENCDRSCYRCLRSYKNKFEHDLLDRQVGASLLRYALTGADPALSSARLAASTDLLFEDLKRQNLDDIEFARNIVLTPPGLDPVIAPIHIKRPDGLEYVVGLHCPLTPDDPPDDTLRALKEFCPTIPVLLCDEIVVRRNLPSATSQLIQQVRF